MITNASNASNASKDLNYRKIKNYYRRYKDIDELRKNLICLYYDNIEGIPVAIRLEDSKIEDIYYKFPYYFVNKDRDELIEIFNKEMAGVHMKPIKIDMNVEIDDYDITGDRMGLKICEKTFRPYYMDDWRKKTEEINGVSYEKQKSFYNDYLKYYLKYREFPTFYEYLRYIFYKYGERPVHKDIKNVYHNIDNSYKSIKEYVREKQMTYNEIRKIIISSTPIKNRKEMEK
jgi:hypothetical protein